jgi:hypothetical protein
MERGGGAQIPILSVLDSKKAGARSAAKTH